MRLQKLQKLQGAVTKVTKVTGRCNHLEPVPVKVSTAGYKSYTLLEYY